MVESGSSSGAAASDKEAGLAWSELVRGFSLIATSFIGIAFGLATLGVTYSLGVIAGPLHEEYGWSRTQIDSAPLCILAGLIPGALLLARLIERLGLRLVVVSSQLAFAACMAALALCTRTLFSWYLIYCIMGFVGVGTLPITFARVLVARFHHARGIALGSAFCGSGLAALLVPYYLQTVIGRYGWRGAYAALALLPLGLALPLAAWCLRVSPGATPTRSLVVLSGNAEGSAIKAGFGALRPPLKSYRFWLLAMVFLLTNAALTGVVTNLIPILTAKGHPPGDAVALAAALGLAVVIGRVIVGLLVDHFWAPAVGCACLSPTALGILLLASKQNTGLTLLAIGLLGLASGAEFDLNAYLVSRYFSAGSFTRIFAFQYLMLALGSAPAIRLFGLSYDVTGNYSMALTTAAAVILACGLSLLALGRYSVPS